MYKLYFKQAMQMLRDNRFISIISIAGTALAITMIMVIIVTGEIKTVNAGPEPLRSRTLYIYKEGRIKKADDPKDRRWLMGSVSYDAARKIKKASTPEYVSVTGNGNRDHYSVMEVCAEGSDSFYPAFVKTVDDVFWKVMSFQFIDGRPFTSEEYESGVPCAVINRSLSQKIFKGEQAIGKTMVVYDNLYKVIGVVEDVNLLLARINRDIAVQNRDNSEKLYRIAETKREIGQLSEADMLQLKGSLLKAEAALIGAGEAMNERMLQLRSQLRLDEKTFIIPVMPGNLSGNVPLLVYEQVLELATENNSFTQNIRRRLLEASRDISKARAERWDAKLFVSYGMSGINSTLHGAMEPANWRNDRSVNVGISVPVLDWGKRKGKVAVAKANKEVLQSRIEKEQMDFNQHINILVMNFNNQPEKLLLAKENDETAQKRYQISVAAFILGKTDVLNLNDSQISKDEARRYYIDQMWSLWSYYYQIRGLTLYDFAFNRPLNVSYSL